MQTQINKIRGERGNIIMDTEIQRSIKDYFENL